MPSVLAEPEPATSAGASQRLRTTMAAVRIMFTWLGVVRLMYPV